MKEEDLFDLWSDAPKVEYSLENMNIKSDDIFNKIKDRLVYEAGIYVVVFFVYMFLFDKNIGVPFAGLHLIVCAIWACISYEFYKNFKSINELSVVKSIAIKRDILRNYVNHLKINMLIGVPVMTLMVLILKTQSNVPFLEALLGDENYYLIKVWIVITLLCYLYGNWYINKKYKVHLRSLNTLCDSMVG